MTTRSAGLQFPTSETASRQVNHRQSVKPVLQSDKLYYADDLAEYLTKMYSVPPLFALLVTPLVITEFKVVEPMNSEISMRVVIQVLARCDIKYLHLRIFEHGAPWINETPHGAEKVIRNINDFWFKISKLLGRYAAGKKIS